MLKNKLSLPENKEVNNCYGFRSIDPVSLYNTLTSAVDKGECQNCSSAHMNFCPLVSNDNNFSKSSHLTFS